MSAVLKQRSPLTSPNRCAGGVAHAVASASARRGARGGGRGRSSARLASSRRRRRPPGPRKKEPVAEIPSSGVGVDAPSHVTSPAAVKKCSPASGLDTKKEIVPALIVPAAHGVAAEPTI